jgi:hypothetical protein
MIVLMLEGTAGFATAVGMGFLAAVFLASGAAKVQHPITAALAMVRFGLTRSVNVWMGRAAGGIEIAVAAAIVLSPSPGPPLTAACLLLLLFVALIARALARGERFPCACFGKHGSPISTSTLTRTVLLLILSLGCLVMAARAAAPPEIGERLLALCVGAVLVALIALALEVHRTAPFSPRFEGDE